MAAIWMDKGVKRTLSGGIILSSGGGHVIKAACIDENDVTMTDSFEFFSEVSAAAVGTPVDITANLSLDATSGEIRCSSFSTGVLTGDPTESVVFYRDTGSAATSPLLSKQDVVITPNGSASFTLSMAGNKLMGVAASGFFHKTLGKLWSGAETLTGASISVQLLTAAPAYTEEFRSAVSNTAGSPVALGSFTLLDTGAALSPAGATLFTGITGTITHAMLYIVKAGASTDLPLGTVAISPSLVLSAADLSLSYPGTGALRFAA
jgi:hypothetical protein